MIIVEKPGLLTTVQDMGRSGSRRLGIPVSGAMDGMATSILNALVGNQSDSPLLEFAMLGPRLRFEQDAVVSLGGASFTIEIDSKQCFSWKPLHIRSGQTLQILRMTSGCYGYLAVQGGLDVAQVLGSCSTNIRAAIGGLNGRALATKDELQIKSESDDDVCWATESLSASYDLTKYIHSTEPIRYIPAAQADWFSQSSTLRFHSETYQVTKDSDRMGQRLSGPALERLDDRELVTEGVGIGTIQIPPDGQPIVLMVDSQPTGGYPKIGVVATVDLPRLAQRRPGDHVMFTPISVQEAHRLLRRQQRDLGRFQTAMRLKWEDISAH